MEENRNKKTKKNRHELITLAEASMFTGYAQEYLNLRCRQGRLQGVKKGRNWYTSQAWISEFQENTVSNRKGERERLKKLQGDLKPSFVETHRNNETHSHASQEEAINNQPEKIQEDVKLEVNQSDQLIKQVVSTIWSVEDKRRYEEKKIREAEKIKNYETEKKREEDNALLREAVLQNTKLVSHLAQNINSGKKLSRREKISGVATPAILIAFMTLVWFVSRDNNVVNLYNNAGKNIYSQNQDLESGAEVAGTEDAASENNPNQSPTDGKKYAWINSTTPMTDEEKKEVAGTVLSSFGILLDKNDDIFGDLRIKENGAVRVEANAIDSEKIRDHTILARDIKDDITLKVKNLVASKNISADGNLNVLGTTTGSGLATFQNGITVSGGNVLFSTGGTITQTGLGQVAFAGNVDADNGLDVDGGNLTVGGTDFTVNATTGDVTISGLAGVGNRCMYADANGIIHVKNADCGAGGGGADNLGDHTMTQNLLTSGFWISNDGGNEGLWVKNDGNVGVGNNNPLSLFSVGPNSEFQVNNSGAITAATGITSSGNIAFTGLAGDGAEATGVLLNGANQLVTREFGSLAFSSATYDNYSHWHAKDSALTDYQISSSDTLNFLSTDTNNLTIALSGGDDADENLNFSVNLNKDLVTGSGLTGGADNVLVGADSDVTISHATGNGYNHVPSDGAATQILQYSAAGTAKWISLSSDATIADGGAITLVSGITRDTEWDTQGEVEAIWGTTLATDSELHSPVTLAGLGYLTLAGQQITAGAINIGTTQVTGTLGLANGGTGLDNTSPQNGQLLIGNGTGYALANITAGTGIQVVNGSGTIALSTTNITTGTGTQNYLPKWNASGTFANSVLYENGGKIGIGTTDPQEALHVNGNVRISNLAGVGNRCVYSDDNGVLHVKAEDCGSASGADNLGNHTMTQNLRTSGYWISNDGDNEGVMVLTNGNVGIGNSNPNYDLEVSGTIGVSGTATFTGLNTDGSETTAVLLNASNQLVQRDLGTGAFATIANYVPTSRSITINGTAQDLSADRSWSVGTVTSVGLSLPAELTTSNSPVTGSGTLTGAWASQNANLIFASPNGIAGTPSFRSMVDSDIPSTIARDTELHTLLTLAGAYDYLTLNTATQVLTLGQVDISDDTNLGVGGTILQISGDTLSLREGTLTNGKLCTYVSGTGLVCDTDSAGVGHSAATVSDTASINLSITGQEISGVVLPAGVDHNSLANLTVGDPHTQYALLAGRAGGQTLIGGSAPTDSLVLQSTSGVGTTGANILFKVGNAGATTAMTILNSGNVGIGTTNPTQKLEVAGVSLFDNNVNLGSSGRLTWDGGLTNTFNVLALSGKNLSFGTNGTHDRMVIDTTGNVGIGTTNPGYKLQVAGTLGVSGTATFTGINSDGSELTAVLLNASNQLVQRELGSNAFNSTGFVDVTGSSANYIPKFSDADTLTNSVMYETGGNIGIGTTNPGVKLNVAGTTYLQKLLTTGNNTYDIADPKAADIVIGSDVGIRHDSSIMLWSSSNANRIFSSGSTLYFSDWSTNPITAANAVFNTIGDGNSYIRAGNFGIGTTNPGNLLTLGTPNIVSTARKAIELAGGGWGEPGAYNTNSDGDKLILFRNATATYDATMGIGTRANLWFKSFGSSAGVGIIEWWTGSDSTNPKMTLNATGNVGIGTTNPSYKLELAGTLGVSGTATFTGVNAGTDNTVLILNSSNQLIQDEIDSRVWGSSLLDYSSTGANYIPKFSDADTLTNSIIYETGSKIGIGTTDPKTYLVVRGTQASPPSSGTAPTGNLRIEASSNTNVLDFGNMAASPYSQWIQSTDRTNLAVTYPLALNPNGGNVGVGTSNPVNKLQIGPGINGWTNNDLMISNANGGLSVYNAVGYTYIEGDQRLDLYGNATYTMSLSSGNVGIGTSNPGYKLQVAGTLGVSGTATFTGINSDGSEATAVLLNASNQLVQRELGTGAFATIANYVPTSRNITINGTAQDLSADRSWSVGTVTSVGISLPAELTVSNSPVTGSGTLTGAWASQNANLIFASPNGIAGTPSFRSMVDGDIPASIARDSELHPLLTLAGAYDYLTLNTATQVLTLGQIDISDDTNLGVGGTILQISGDTISLREGTLTNGKLCSYVSGTGLVCDTDSTGVGHSATTVSDTSSIDLSISGQQISGVVLSAGVDHNSLANLTTGDAHTQYALLGGRSGGQTLIGGSNPTDSLTLQSTSGVGTTGANIFFKVGNNGATTAMTILNSSNVGIGTTNPGYKLEIVGTLGVSGTATFTGLNTDGSETTAVMLNASNQLVQRDLGTGAFATIGNYVPTSRSLTINGTAYDLSADRTWTITSSQWTTYGSNIAYAAGNVGIGTTSPGSLLEISGGSDNTANLRIFKSDMASGAYSAIWWGRAASAGQAGALDFKYKDASTSTAALGVWGDDVSAGMGVLVKKGGNVGIGTSNPLTYLVVRGTQASPPNSGTTPTGNFRIEASNNTNVLDFGNMADSPYSQWIQSTDRTNLAVTYPLALNPIGGNVGIGTTNPTYKLQVAGTLGVSGTATFTGLNTDGSETTAIMLNASNQLVRRDLGTGAFATIANYVPTSRTLTINGTAYDLSADRSWTISSSQWTTYGSNIAYTAGSVGIGTTSPGARLTVSGEGTGNILMGSAGFGGNYASMSFNNTLSATNYNFTGGPDNHLFINRPTGGNIFFRENNAEASQMVLLAGGNVGIGTTNPAYKLEVAGTLGVSGTATFTGLNSDGSETTAVFLNASNQLVQRDLGTGAFATIANYVPTSRSLTINGTAYDLSADRTWTINSSQWTTYGSNIAYTAGSVGIGTTSPATKLHVVGTAGQIATIESNSTDATSLRLINSSVPKTFDIGLGGSAGGSPGGFYVYDATATQFRFVISSTGNIGLGSTAIAAPSLYITSGGNVGISMTNPTAKLQVYTDTSSALGNVILQASNWDSQYAGYNISWNNNFGGGSGGNFAQIRSAQDAGNSAYIAFLNMDSGASGAVTEHMRIISTGNVGIGTTNPGYKLQVAGTLGVSSTAYFASTVGIGTTNPAQLLEISNTGGAAAWKLTGSGANVVATVTNEFDLNYTRTTGNAIMDFGAFPASGTNAAYYRFGVSSGSTGENYLQLAQPNSTTIQTQFVSSGASSFINAGGGNLGIGTTNPSTFKLQVAGSVGPQTNDTYDLGSDALRWQSSYIGPGTIHIGTSTADEYTLSYDTTNNRLGFNVNGSGNPEIVMDSSGNLGIGTTNPTHLLAVNGNMGIGSSGYINFGATDGTTGYGFRDNGGSIEFKSSGGNWSTIGTGGGQMLGVYATSAQLTNSSVNFNGAANSQPSYSGGVLTLPSNTSYIVVEVWGGGGGGGTASGYSGAGGGGGGGYSSKMISNVSGTYYFTTGASGAAGGNGGTSCFGTNSTACTTPSLSATGGSAGSNGVDNNYSQGGAGGSGSSGDINISGNYGQFGELGGNGVGYGKGGTGGGAAKGGGGGGYGASGYAYGGGGQGGNASNMSGYTGGTGGIAIYVYTTGISNGSLASGIAGQFAYYSTAGTNLAATSTLFMSGTSLGIGFTAPGSKLTISGGLAVGTTSASSVYLTKLAPDGGALFEGFVGIGTTSPTNMFSIAKTANGADAIGSANNPSILIDDPSHAVSGKSELQFAIAGSVSSAITNLYEGDYAPPGGHEYGAALLFSTKHAVASGGLLERMRIDSNGNVGIGTTNPGYKLVVSGNDVNGWQTRFITSYSGGAGGILIGSRYANVGAIQATNGTGTVQDLSLNPDGGNVGIGTNTPRAKLEVNGYVSYAISTPFAGAGGNGAWNTGLTGSPINASIIASNNIAATAVYTSSDKRLKNSIASLDSETVNQFLDVADPVHFQWNSDNSTDSGFIAQDLITSGFGYLVSAVPDATMQAETENGFESPAGAHFIVKYDSIVPLLTMAAKEQRGEILDIKNEISQMSGDMEESSGRISDIQAQLADSNMTTTDKINLVGTTLSNVSLETQNLASLQAGQESRIKTLEDQMALLEEKTQAVLDLADALKADKVIYKDAAGNVNILGGTLEADGVVAGAYTVKVDNASSATMGTAVIHKFVDNNLDGVDDNYPDNDGKTIWISTTAVSSGSRVFVTPRVTTKIPLAVTAVVSGEKFKVETADPVSTDLEFDWWIVEQK